MGVRGVLAKTSDDERSDARNPSSHFFICLRNNERSPENVLKRDHMSSGSGAGAGPQIGAKHRSQGPCRCRCNSVAPRVCRCLDARRSRPHPGRGRRNATDALQAPTSRSLGKPSCVTYSASLAPRECDCSAPVLPPGRTRSAPPRTSDRHA